MSPITTTAEAEQAIDDRRDADRQIIRPCRTGNRAGARRQGAQRAEIGRQKAELAGKLYASGERLKANAKFLLQAAPARCAALARLQEGFRAVLQKNLIVLATAHAVSEGIVRRLSGDLARKTSPQVYGATGRATAPHPRHGQPLAISRKL